ncbi:MAG: hypothetical protein RBS37_07360 [Bacteroidales bacterium]|jgi:hypothetical protein|nr:hypothetical protein [Bacteroidales bacterium]
MVLHIIYIIILAYLTVIIALEFWHEKRWKLQIAMAMVLLVFILRLLQIK